MSDISLLPQDFREKEEELKKEQETVQETAGGTTMHVPKSETDDVEVIEVDESEVDQILKTEPLMSRLVYKAGIWFERTRDKLFKTRKAEPPPKAPPQFFQPNAMAKPPAPAGMGLGGKPGAPGPAMAGAGMPTAVGSMGMAGAGDGKPKARIIPSGASPRKVKIIKRVRQPMHVSFLDQELVRTLQINIPKRKVTLGFLALFFAAVFAGTYFLIDKQQVNASAAEDVAAKELGGLRSQIMDLQKKWTSFQDLEPRLMALNDLMDKHVSILHVLKILEQKTLTDVSYAGFMLDSGGQLHLAVTAPSYEAAAKQLQIFKDSPEIKGVDATAFAYTAGTADKQGTVNFQLNLQLQTPALLFESPVSER
jgi:hypothetical protein